MTKVEAETLVGKALARPHGLVREELAAVVSNTLSALMPSAAESSSASARRVSP